MQIKKKLKKMRIKIIARHNILVNSKKYAIKNKNKKKTMIINYPMPNDKRLFLDPISVGRDPTS